jgi:hypothetical protein
MVCRITKKKVKRNSGEQGKEKKEEMKGTRAQVRRVVGEKKNKTITKECVLCV